ncbi:MAG: hypothetical protein HUJ26_13065 [Planctomycetaceae bacterium]|nr:hypothetical protein [Planctomycetaceae bacterium]
MTQELTARQIINSLSVDQIDEEIGALEGELKRLKELRRVAVKREGKSPGKSPRKTSGSAPDEIANLVTSALAAGPLTMQEISDSTGLSHGQLRPTISKVPGVEKVDGLWTLRPQTSDDD